MNRHERRVLDAAKRQRARALLKFIPDGFMNNPKEEQPRIALQLAYRAWHAGILTDRQARAVGCSTGRSG